MIMSNFDINIYLSDSSPHSTVKFEEIHKFILKSQSEFFTEQIIQIINPTPSRVLLLESSHPRVEVGSIEPLHVSLTRRSYNKDKFYSRRNRLPVASRAKHNDFSRCYAHNR